MICFFSSSMMMSQKVPWFLTDKEELGFPLMDIPEPHSLCCYECGLSHKAAVPCVEGDQHRSYCSYPEVSIYGDLETLCDQKNAVHMKNETALIYHHVVL